MTFEGCGRYLSEKQEPRKKSALAVRYFQGSVYEEILDATWDKVNIDGLDAETEATHVLAGITWGANCTIHCSSERVEVAKWQP